MAFLANTRNVIFRDLGGCAAPQNSFLMLQGLETLSQRMEQHCKNALGLAEFLSAHPAVEWVNYPGLTDSPFRSLAEKQFGGRGGAILTFGPKEGIAPFACLDRFKLAKRMTNLGDARTLVLHPASTIFAEYSEEERRGMGIGDDMIRVSVGMEDLDDLKDDFEQALGPTK
jgi:O-acetylhomoserine (thiol)-lyase